MRAVSQWKVADRSGRNDPAAQAVRDVWDSGIVTAPGAQLPQLPRLEDRVEKISNLAPKAAQAA